MKEIEQRGGVGHAAIRALCAAGNREYRVDRK